MMVLGIFSPAILSANFWIAVIGVIAIAGILSLGIQLNTGFTGILNVGQVGFMAIGAYATAILVIDVGLSFWLAVLVATAIAVSFALVIGLSSLRLRAEYFAIVTLAAAEIVRFTARNARELTGGVQGLTGYDSDWRRVSQPIMDFFSGIGLGTSRALPLAVVSWIIFLVLVVVLTYAMRTPWGRAIKAIREDEDAARALGKNVLFYKLQSLSIAAALGSLSGCLFALDVRFLVPEGFEPTVTFLAFAAVVLGGLGSFWGVVAGTTIVWTLLEMTRFLELPISSDRIGAIRFILVGLALILLSMLRPQGLFGKKEEMALSAGP